MSDPRIRIDFACNDPDNGLPIGRVAQIQVACGLLELSASRWNLLSNRGLPLFREVGGGIVLSGKPWPIVRSCGWYGNWCWDAHWMEAAVATQFLFWLRQRRLFVCDEAEDRLAAWWTSDRPLFDDEPEFVHRQLVKAMLAEART